MARFGEFRACRANFVPLWPPTTRAGRTLYRIQGGCGASRHNRTPGVAGVESTGGSGGPGCGARGRRQGLASRAAGHSRGARERWQGQAAVLVGGGGAWPGFETTRRTRPQRPSPTGVEGAGGSGGHGRASRRGAERSEALASRAAGPSGARNTSGNKHRTNAQAYKKPTSAIGCRPVVELGGFEPPTFSLRTRRATNCAIAPRTRTA